ncbi:uncharacterized protein DS421_15g489200 [Arachis hypogaea]|nr:uncharacterized protein DS421_15g489200 [Arachis hypogaea]
MHVYKERGVYRKRIGIFQMKGCYRSLAAVVDLLQLHAHCFIDYLIFFLHCYISSLAEFVLVCIVFWLSINYIFYPKHLYIIKLS